MAGRPTGRFAFSFCVSIVQKDERQPPMGGCRSCTHVACAPVSRIWSARARRGGHHLSGTTVAGRLKRPTCTVRRLASVAIGGPPSPVRSRLRPGRNGATWPCTPWGLPGRSRHRERRCALTAPFHPLPRRPKPAGGTALCCTCHLPRAPGCGPAMQSSR